MTFVLASVSCHDKKKNDVSFLDKDASYHLSVSPGPLRYGFFLLDIISDGSLTWFVTLLLLVPVHFSFTPMSMCPLNTLYIYTTFF